MEFQLTWQKQDKHIPTIPNLCAYGMAFGVAFQFFLVHYIEGKKENNQFGCKHYIIGLVQLFELNTIKRFLNFVFTKL